MLRIVTKGYIDSLKDYINALNQYAEVQEKLINTQAETIKHTKKIIASKDELIALLKDTTHASPQKEKFSEEGPFFASRKDSTG
jgi:hypothetical protein